MSYPRNAASPPRIAIGPVVQASDGAVQTSGVSVKVKPEGGAASAGSGTISYEEGIVAYVPTQGETDYTAFQLIAYKTGCIPAAVTVVTSASATAGKVVLSGETHTSAVIPTVTTLTNAPSDSSGTTTLLTRLSSARAGYLDNINNANLASVPAFPSNFASLGINASGHVSRVTLADTITTYTGNTVQTGDAYARIGAAGSGLTSLAQASAWTSTRAGYVDNLSGGPVMLAASYSAPPSAATIADAVWDEDIATGHQTENMAGWSLNHIHGMADVIYGLVDTEVAAIKAKTDQLTFTVANQVDSNALTNGGLDAAGVRAAVGLASANLDTQLGDVPTNSELATAIMTGLTTALAEGYRADGATGSVRDLLYELSAHMGEASIVSTTKTLKKIDGTTTAQTYTLDSGSAPTSITRAS